MKSKRTILWTLAGMALAGLAVFIVFGLRGLGTAGLLAPRPAPLSPPGQALRPAPDFTLQTFDRKPLALSDFKGKIVILNFWASWCTPCKQEMPSLERAWKEFGERGVVVLGIDVSDDPEDAVAFMKALQITYPIVYDPEQARMNAYQVTALPTTFFIDTQMRIRGRFVGGYLGEEGYRELRRQILALLKSPR